MSAAEKLSQVRALLAAYDADEHAEGRPSPGWVLGQIREVVGEPFEIIEELPGMPTIANRHREYLGREVRAEWVAWPREYLGREVRAEWVAWPREQTAPAPEDPMPNPLLVPLSRYASGLEAVAAQGGCSVATADKLLRAVRLIRLAISGAPIDPTRPALTEEEAVRLMRAHTKNERLILFRALWKVAGENRGEAPPEVRAPQTPEVHSAATCAACAASEDLGGGSYAFARAPWRPTTGARVVTADPLTGSFGRLVGRRPLARGVCVSVGNGRTGTPQAWVRHDDGTEAPYDVDELRPAPKENDQ